ncbi:MAG TPA: hypothetical protein DIC18_02640, partial [Clostridiales bacterium]|nr:hypothetical protein [Clostridiales bacterium]
FIPTVYSYAIHGSRTGEPIIRPLFYDHMDEPKLYAVDDEFYLGEHILVAPVTQADTDKREVYLPKGNWVNNWTKERFVGDQTITANAPMFQKEGLPMYVKVGGGVAYQPDCTSLYDRIPDSLRVELYADTDAELVLNESQSVTNVFRCKKVGAGFEAYAENNGESDRKYLIVIYCDGKKLSREITVKAGAAARVEMR